VVLSVAHQHPHRTLPEEHGAAGQARDGLRHHCDVTALPGQQSFLPDDPYNEGNKVGGYCTFLGGKLTGSIGDNGFDARARTGERVFGRTDCAASTPGAPPSCGSDLRTPYDPESTFHLGDLFGFLDTLLYRVPDTTPAQFRVQPFFVWYAPRIPH